MSDGEGGDERLFLENKQEIAKWRRRIRGKREQPSVALAALTDVTSTEDRKKKKKRTKYPKHSKKSWPKIDVKDIEEHEEEERFNERVGHKVEELADKDLFTIEKDVPEVGKKPPKKKAPKGKELTDSLSCFRRMNLRSAVKPAGGPENMSVEVSMKDWEKRNTTKIEKRILKRGQKGEALDEKPKTAEQIRKGWTKPFAVPKFYDIWGDDKVNGLDKNDPEIKQLIEHQERGRNRPTQPRPKRLNNKPNLIPAIEPPHPGESYNPSLIDHQDLLKKPLEREIKEHEKEKRFERKVLQYFPKGNKGYYMLEKNYTKEMLSGLGLSDEEEEEEDKAKEESSKKSKKISEEQIKNFINSEKTTSKDPKRKTRAQRNAEKRKRAEQISKMKAARIRRKEEQVNHLEEIQQAIERREKRLEEKRRRIEQKKQDALYKPPKYYPEPEPDFQFTEELATSLRKLKPAGSLLAERYRSYRKRNVFGASRRKEKDTLLPKINRRKAWKEFEVSKRRYKKNVMADR